MNGMDGIMRPTERSAETGMTGIVPGTGTVITMAETDITMTETDITMAETDVTMAETDGIIVGEPGSLQSADPVTARN